VFLFGRLGEGGIGLCSLPQPHEDVQEERVQPSGQALGGTEGG
jgi:hypothetical protein